MTSLSPANAERLKLAFQECRDMEGTLNEQLQAYAAAGREYFPAYGEAVDRLVARIRLTRRLLRGPDLPHAQLRPCHRDSESLVDRPLHLQDRKSVV